MAKIKPVEHNVDAPDQPVSEKKRKRREKNLLFYPLGTVGRDMMYYLFNNCILTYILFTKQLTSEQLIAITVIMVAARVFDALNDPIMGNIIERTRSRWGKFKPFFPPPSSSIWPSIRVCRDGPSSSSSASSTLPTASPTRCTIFPTGA